MFKNYVKVAWRNLRKHRFFSFLNVFGLAIGITCAVLIFLWVEDEVNFNTNFPKQDLVYYVPTNNEFEGETFTFFSTPGPLARDLKTEIPEIERAATSWSGEILLANGEQGINRVGRYAQPDFLEIFSLSFVEGDPNKALNRPDGIVLSQSTATALFGEDTQALNQVLKINDAHTFTVTGVVEDLPKNITFGFEWLLPFERFQLGEDDMSWAQLYGNNFADTFVELAPNADMEAVDAKVRAFIPMKMKDSGSPPNEAFLHAIKDWHLRSDFKDGKIVGGRITSVRLIAIIGLVILLIASINFMNLSTARSEKRANEVGVRKVLGSGKKGLVHQFLVEALLLASLATIISVVFVYLLLPAFNGLVEKELHLQFTWFHVSYLFGIAVVSGFLAGWYPALYLSSFHPIAVFKGLSNKWGGVANMRQGLVVIQFACSIVFIISALIISQQLLHVKERDLGYNKDNLIDIPVSGDMVKNFIPLTQDLIGTGNVQNVALTNTSMLSGGNNGSNLRWQGGTNTEDVLVRFRFVSPSFFETTGLHLLEGRHFSDNTAADSTNIIITASFAGLMGPGSALGKTVFRYNTTYTVIGVVNDYLYGNLFGSGNVGPVMFFNNPEYANTLYVSLKDGVTGRDALSSIESVFKKHNPSFPFEYRFENDLFNARFKKVELMGRLAEIFTGLAILICCLGLIGLSAYTIEIRKKEIGIRKVLGSSVSGIITLLSKDFIRLVLIALAFAIPLGWWLMKNWLEGYPYRIEMNFWVFGLAGATALLIAMLTVSFQAVYAAMSNPVKSLRTE